MPVWAFPGSIRGYAPDWKVIRLDGFLVLSSGQHEQKGQYMPLYEHVFLARQDVSNQQVEAMTKEFTDIITEGGGSVSKSEYWGLKSLAYKIKKSRKAHYSLLNIDAPPPAVAEMERRMSLSTDVIRFMTIKVAEHETEPSVMMRKSDRDDRGGRGGHRGGPRGGGGGGGSTFRSRSGPPPRGPRDGNAGSEDA